MIHSRLTECPRASDYKTKAIQQCLNSTVNKLIWKIPLIVLWYFCIFYVIIDFLLDLYFCFINNWLFYHNCYPVAVLVSVCVYIYATLFAGIVSWLSGDFKICTCYCVLSTDKLVSLAAFCYLDNLAHLYIVVTVSRKAHASLKVKNIVEVEMCLLERRIMWEKLSLGFLRDNLCVVQEGHFFRWPGSMIVVALKKIEKCPILYLFEKRFYCIP